MLLTGPVRRLGQAARAPVHNVELVVVEELPTDLDAVGELDVDGRGVVPLHLVLVGHRPVEGREVGHRPYVRERHLVLAVLRLHVEHGRDQVGQLVDLLVEDPVKPEIEEVREVLRDMRDSH